MSNFTPRVTVKDAINRALGVMGLPQQATVVGSSDATARQMLALLTEAGQSLLDEHEWQFLSRVHEFTTTDATEYDLPSDFRRFVDETGWNRTGRMPLIGPVNSQQWAMLQARQLGGTTLQLQYIISEDKFVLYFAPTPEQTVAIDYLSRGWLQSAADATVHFDIPQADADLILYDSVLIIACLVLRWRDAKGFDTSSAERKYERALNAAKYADRPKQDLSLNRRQSMPFIGVNNISDTNYG